MCNKTDSIASERSYRYDHNSVFCLNILHMYPLGTTYGAKYLENSIDEWNILWEIGK